MRISDWSSDVCSSDLLLHLLAALRGARRLGIDGRDPMPRGVERSERRHRKGRRSHEGDAHGEGLWRRLRRRAREMAGDCFVAPLLAMTNIAGGLHTHYHHPMASTETIGRAHV